MNQNLLDKIRGSKFAEFMRDKVKPVVGDVMQVVGDITGVESIERVGELLNKRKEQNDEVKALAAEFEMKRVEWEMEMQKIIIQNDLEQLKLEVSDRQSARDMRSKMGGKDPLMWACAFYVMACAGILIWVGLFRVLTQEQSVIHARMEGFFFGTGLAALFQFMWGTTRGSQRKTELLSEK